MTIKEHYLGPYLIEHRLAAGGMAEVFVAKRMGPHGFAKRVAVKRILPQFAKDPDFVAMFIDEATLAAKLDHPNIIQVFDFGEFEEALFLAMELVDGSNVNHLLRTATSQRDPIPPDVAIQIAYQSARALAYAHALTDEAGTPLKIVHRDVSPANLLLTRTGHVKLSDFGIARLGARDRRTEEGHIRGKLGYMSPEQVLGKPLDGRSDVFTLTTVFAEMLLSEPLFGRGRDLEVLLRIRDTDLRVLDKAAKSLSPEIYQLLVMGLARNPSDRPTASSFADAIDEVIRKRGRSSHSPDRVARFLNKLGLITPRPGDEKQHGPSAAPSSTMFAVENEKSSDTERVIQNLGITSPALYVIEYEDGSRMGPVSYPKLIEFFTSGVINSHSKISKSQSQPVEASELPELSRFVTSPALQWKEQINKAIWTGELGPAHLLPIVFQLWLKRETGVLLLSDTERKKKIYFIDGRPEFIASTMQKELLGEYLIASGQCLSLEVEMALALLPRYGGRLGDALVGMGVLRPIQLFRSIAAQVRERFLESFRWRVGQWAYYRGERSHEETFPLGQDPLELMRDAALLTHPEELEIALSPVMENILVQAVMPPASVAAYRLPATWHRLLSGLQGNTTLSGIIAREVAEGSVDAEEVCRAFFLGLACQLVEARHPDFVP